MRAIIEIVFSIRLIAMLLLVHETNGFNNQMIKYNVRSHSTNKVVSGIAQDSIIMKWMNMEVALKKAYVNLIRSLLPKAAMGMRLTSNVSQSCTYSLFEYFNGLRNMKTWSYKMLDATGKLPTGLIAGNPMSFGDYDTCLEVVAPSQKFKGQYCSVEFHLPLPKRKILTPVEMPVEGIHGIFEPESFTEHFSNMAGFLYNSQIRLTTCLPSTCSKRDIRNLFSNVMGFLKFETQVKVTRCETNNDEEELTGLEIFIFVLFGFIFCLVVLGTLQDILLRNTPKYDIATAEKSAIVKALLCFSAYTNFMRLIKEDDNPDSLRIFHGIRVMSTLWIIWSHVNFPVNYKTFDGSLHSMDMAKEFLHQLVPLGFLVVETFFFMSSVLVAYICVRMRGNISMSSLFLKRYLRLTPSLMLVTAFYAVIGRFGSGPLWHETVVIPLSKNCLERGWLNLFYVNNYTYSNKACLGWTWYLSADTQMFLLSLYVCILLRRKPGRGLLAIGLMLIAGVIWTFLTHLYYKIPPMYLQTFMHLDDWYYFSVKGHTQLPLHLPICAIGIVVGYILATKRGHIPKHINVIGWTLSPMVFFTLMFFSYKWNQGMHAHPGIFVSALYGSLHRIAWTLCLAFMTLSCTWGQGGIVNSFLSWKGFVPFARLTYSVYLVQYGLVNVYVGLLRQSMTFDNRTMSLVFFNNVFISFLVALVLCICFESPIMAMEKAFSDGKLKKQIQPVSAIQGPVILKHSV